MILKIRIQLEFYTRFALGHRQYSEIECSNETSGTHIGGRCPNTAAPDRRMH